LSSLRIALLSPFPPLKGGIARFSERLGRALEEEGCEVIPVTFRRLWPRWLMKGRPASEPGVTVLHDTQLSLVLLNPLSWLAVARRLRAVRPDVLLFAYWSGALAPLCMMIRRVSGLKTVVLLHNFTSHESIPGESMLKRMLVASSEGFITLSRTVESELKAFMPEANALALFHPFYEPQGPAPSRQEARQALGLPEASKVLLFFGYIREYKGVDTLLESMAIVLRKDSSVRLVVAGEFILDSSVFRLHAERLGIAGQVDIYEGYVPSGQVACVMAAADAVVLPYRSATQSGIVSLAFGHGVPVIAFSTGALGDQIEHGRNGWLVRGTGADAFADGILDFFREREHLPLSEGIEEACRRNSWSRFASESLAFLERCNRGNR
jgi:glycosyltransferase involved in cell wall biosynthesis